MRIFVRTLILLLAAASLEATEPAAPALGSAEFKPTPDRPCGWRGDWSGRYVGATPPTSWSRRVRGVTSALRYQAAKPAGDPSKDARPLEYFSIKDWLVDNILYGVDMTGGMTAVDVQAQKGLYRRWLEGYNRFNRYLYGVAASPTLAGKHIYIVDDAGDTHLIAPGPQFKETG